MITVSLQCIWGEGRWECDVVMSHMLTHTHTKKMFCKTVVTTLAWVDDKSDAVLAEPSETINWNNILLYLTPSSKEFKWQLI